MADQTPKRIFTSQEEADEWQAKVDERTGHLFANEIRKAINTDPNAPATALSEMHQQAVFCIKL